MENKVKELEDVFNRVRTKLFWENAYSLHFWLSAEWEDKWRYVIYTYDRDWVIDKYITLTELIFWKNDFWEVVSKSNRVYVAYRQDTRVIMINPSICYGDYEGLQYDKKYECYKHSEDRVVDKNAIDFFKMRLSIMTEDEQVDYLKMILFANSNYEW